MVFAFLSLRLDVPSCQDAVELGEELVASLDTQQRRQFLDLLSRLNKEVLMDEVGDEE